MSYGNSDGSDGSSSGGYGGDSSSSSSGGGYGSDSSSSSSGGGYGSDSSSSNSGGGYGGDSSSSNSGGGYGGDSSSNSSSGGCGDDSSSSSSDGGYGSDSSSSSSNDDSNSNPSSSVDSTSDSSSDNSYSGSSNSSNVNSNNSVAAENDSSIDSSSNLTGVQLDGSAGNSLNPSLGVVGGTPYSDDIGSYNNDTYNGISLDGTAGATLASSEPATTYSFTGYISDNYDSTLASSYQSTMDMSGFQNTEVTEPSLLGSAWNSLTQWADQNVVQPLQGVYNDYVAQPINNVETVIGNIYNNVEPMINNIENATSASQLLDTATTWLNDTTPIASTFTVPQGDDLLSKSTASATGSITGALSEVEKAQNITAYTNKQGFYQQFPGEGINTISRPLKSLEKTGTYMTVATTGLDIGNTWTTDDGNTNLQRIEKTAIQVAGSVVAYGFGNLVTAPMVKASVALVPESIGASLALVPIAGGLDYKAAQKIDEVQKNTYKSLGIKN